MACLRIKNNGMFEDERMVRSNRKPKWLSVMREPFHQKWKGGIPPSSDDEAPSFSKSIYDFDFDKSKPISHVKKCIKP